MPEDLIEKRSGPLFFFFRSDWERKFGFSVFEEERFENSELGCRSKYIVDALLLQKLFFGELWSESVVFLFSKRDVSKTRSLAMMDC